MQLRAHLRQLDKENNDLRSILSLLAKVPDQDTIAFWAVELGANGFAHHSADDVRGVLLVRFREDFWYKPPTHDCAGFITTHDSFVIQ